MADAVCADWIPEPDLQALLNSMVPQFTEMILEAVDEVSFNPFALPIDLHRFATGRVFGMNCELRWERDGDLYHTLLIGDAGHVPAVLARYSKDLSVDPFITQPEQYFVWGEWSERLPEWVEARIPHIFLYPQPANRQGKYRRQIFTTEYINQVTGEREFYRFTHVQEVAI
jgi:hypothetical protein